MAFVIVQLTKRQYVRWNWKDKKIHLVSEKDLAKKFSQRQAAQSFFDSQLSDFYRRDKKVLKTFQIIEESRCNFAPAKEERKETQTMANMPVESIDSKLPPGPQYASSDELSLSDLMLVLSQIPQSLAPLLILNEQAEKALNDCLLEIKYRDKEILDLMHKAEFSTPNAAEGYRIFKEIHDSRIRRRQAKDAAALLQIIQDTDFLASVKKFGDAYAAYRYNLENRQYHPRIRSDLFEKQPGDK